MEYIEIKNNIINNFLIPYYKYTSVKLISLIARDINKRSWFPVNFNDEQNIISFLLDNNIYIDVKLIFKKTEDNKFILINFE